MREIFEHFKRSLILENILNHEFVEVKVDFELKDPGNIKSF